MRWHGSSVAGYLCALMLLAGAVRADYLSYQDVPYVYTQSPERFAALWTRGQAQTVRVALLGDSQETAPGGQGYAYVPDLRYAFFQHYGNTPETALALPSSYGGGDGHSDWLLSGAAVGCQSLAVPPSLLPPGLMVARTTSSSYGTLTMLRPDGSDLPAGVEVPAGTYFDRSQVYAQVFAVTAPTSDGLLWSTQPSATGIHNYYAPVSASGTLNLDLRSPTWGVRTGEIGPLDFAGQPYVQMVLRGDGENGADVLGVRFRNGANAAGVTVQNFAAGGYQAQFFLDRNADSAPVLRALGPFDAVMLHFGANESTNRTVAAMHDDLVNLIAALRSPAWLDNPDLLVILATDPDVADLTPEQRLEFDRHAGMMQAIAAADPDVLVLNSRRMMDDLGWRAGQPAFDGFVADGVHYTPLGAQTLAAAEVNALLSVPEPGTLALVAGAAVVLLRRRGRQGQSSAPRRGPSGSDC